MMKLNTGDRVLVDGHSWLAKIIKKVMLRYAKQEGLDPKFTRTHAGTIVIIQNEVRIVESVANGLVPNYFDEHYNMATDNIMIVAPRKEYTEEEQAKIVHYALDLIAVNNFYQYWSLLCWLAYVYVAFKYKNKWHRLNLFGKGNKFSNVCYESTHLIAKQVRPEDFPENSEQATCFHLYDKKRDIIRYYREIV